MGGAKPPSGSVAETSSHVCDASCRLCEFCRGVAPARSAARTAAARVVRLTRDPGAVGAGLLEQSLALLGRDSLPEVPEEERRPDRAGATEGESSQTRH